MRGTHVCRIGVVSTVMFWACSATAQQPYQQQGRGSETSFQETDLLRPFTSRTTPRERVGRYYPEEQRASYPVEVRRSEPAPRRNYYPTLRSGQGPNQNVPQHHCVPSRHSLYYR